MPLLTATSTFTLGRSRQISAQWFYLHHLHTSFTINNNNNNQESDLQKILEKNPKFIISFSYVYWAPSCKFFVAITGFVNLTYHVNSSILPQNAVTSTTFIH